MSEKKNHSISPSSKQQDETRRHFANNLDTIIKATGIGMWDWDIKTGHIVHSGQFERIAGYDDGEMPGADTSARDKLILPADRKHADDIIAACINGEIDNYETEFRIVCKNGDIKWIQDRGAVAGRDENGKATRIVGMFYGIDRFKATEAALSAKLRMLDIVSGMSGLGTLEWDLLTGKLKFDDDFLLMFGYKENEVAETFDVLDRYIESEDFAQMSRELARFVSANDKDAVYSKQVRARPKKGNFLWVVATARIVEWDNEGRPTRIYAGVLNVDKLKRANSFLIDVLSTTVEFRNFESGEHVKRMQNLTYIFLRMMQDEYRLKPDLIETIADAAVLHDIGKIAIPDSVLLKPGPLTKEEFEIMKTHTLRGCEILKSLNYVPDQEYYKYCYEICRHHHERWDGNGYPDKLKGDEISIWAQAASLADVYDALTSDRVYKKAYSHDEAAAMILGGECGVFNPVLMDHFKSIHHDLPSLIAEMSTKEKVH
ncbi:PAS domain-containing protein [Christensenellaceae bacterium OttesenSCG-928-K19]|nr:PAS domain-containing protein [Christensenellaceae bacterium OttesenSCG-928-K19]